MIRSIFLVRRLHNLFELGELARGTLGLRLSRQALSIAKADNGIHRLEDERPPLALRLLLCV